MQRWPFTPAPVRAAWRWARGIRLALVILALAAGINFLSNQSWGASGETFSCDAGQTLTWHSIDHGNGYDVECVTRH